MPEEFTEIRTAPPKERRSSRKPPAPEAEAHETPPTTDSSSEAPTNDNVEPVDEPSAPDGISDADPITTSTPRPPTPRPPAQRVVRPPAGAATDLRQVQPIAPRATGTTELRRTPQPPRGAAPTPPRPPAQAAPTPPPTPPAPLTDAQREDLSEVYRQVLAYAGRYPGHPSGDQALEAARQIGLLLR